MATLNLSENKFVNDDVLKDLSTLFSEHSTLVNLYLNDTSLTLQGLNWLLSSIKESLKVRQISFRRCGINLSGREGEKIVNLLKQNISLTLLGYHENQFDLDFANAADAEIELNKRIVEYIFP